MNKKMYRLMSLIVAFVLTFAGYYQAQASATLAPLMSASIYYVSATGNDANTCTQSASCKTIKRGMSVAQSGDTVIVSAGVYHEYVYVDKSITIVSNGATVDGVNASGSVTDGLVSVVASNVKFQGFTISNAKTYGLANFGNNSQFSNNIIHHTQGAGIWMRDGKFNTFEGNELYDTVLQNSVSFDGTSYTCNPSATTWPSAINSWGAAGSNTWRGNNVHDNCGEGMVVYTGDLVENNTFKNNWSIEVYIVANNTIVRNNTIIDTKPYTPRGSDQSWRSVPAGIAIGDESVCLSDNNTITGNKITGSRYGVSFYAYIPCSGIKNSLIENNTIINAWEYGLRILTGAHTNSTIRNNTVQLTSGKPLTIQNSGFTMIGNILFSSANVFEWNGMSYNFVGWNNVVPGNFWATVGTVTATYTPTPIAQVSPTATATTAPVLPTATATLPAVTVTAPPTSIPPTATASLTPIAPTATMSPIPVVPTITLTSGPTSGPPTPTIQQVSETMYDDRNSAFIYSAGWNNISKRQAYNSSYKLTTQNDAFVTFTFTGQSFSVLYKGGSNFRNMNVYVDDVLVGTINERTSTSSFQQRWDYAGQLALGRHILKLVFVTSDTSNNTDGSIDAVIVR